MFFDVEDLRTNEIFLKLDKTCEEQPEKKWLPAYYFDICLLNGTIIGHCDLRIGHNEKTYIGGNIGYGIDEEYRGHHYAVKACELLFKQAKKHSMDYLIITCVPDNIASSRTCEIVGGKFWKLLLFQKIMKCMQKAKGKLKSLSTTFEKIHFRD